MSAPFFTRFLEKQKENAVDAAEIEGGRPIATLKYPSDDDEVVTLKYPSDDDEVVTLKYPSDDDESVIGG